MAVAATAAATVVTAGGCFSLDLPPGSLRCTSGICPAGLSCLQGRCYPPGWTLDGGADARSPTTDGPAEGGLEAGRADGESDAIAPADPFAPFTSQTPQASLNKLGAVDDPALTADMLEIFFEFDNDIWRSSRTDVTAAWDPPARVEELSDPLAEDTNIALRADGLEILFGSDRSGSFLRVWRATRASRKSAFGAPAQVIELATGDRTLPEAFSADGLQLVLSSSHDAPGAERDLYLSERSGTSAKWGPLVELASLNTTTLEHGAWLAGDKRLIYFSSRRGSGDDNLWVATAPASGGAFGQPVEVASINTTADEEDAWLSADLRTLFFVRNKKIVQATRP